MRYATGQQSAGEWRDGMLTKPTAPETPAPAEAAPPPAEGAPATSD